MPRIPQPYPHEPCPGVVGSEVVEVTGELLSVECGCFGEGEGGTPSPVSASAPTPVGDSGCSGTDSFSITSGTFEDFEGCYVDAGVDSSSFFSRTGQFAGGLEAVFPSFLGDDQQDVRVNISEPSRCAPERLLVPVGLYTEQLATSLDFQGVLLTL